MRATLCEMHLFNNASRKHDTSFILNGKEWGVSKTNRERERERERMSKEWKAECGWERVVAWVINLAVGQVFMRVYWRDNSRVYQDEHKAYPNNFLWSISLSTSTFHLSNKLTIYHKMINWLYANKMKLGNDK